MAKDFELSGKATLDASQADAELGKLNEKLQELQAQQKLFVEKFGEASPQVKEINNQISELQTRIADIKPVTLPINPVIPKDIPTSELEPLEMPVAIDPNLETDLTKLEAILQSLKQQAEEFKKQFGEASPEVASINNAIADIERQMANIKPIDVPVNPVVSGDIQKPEIKPIEIPIDIDPNVETDIDKLEEALSKLKDKAEEFKEKFGESAPEVEAVNSVIVKLQNQISKLKVPSSVPKSLSELRNELKIANATLQITIQQFGRSSKEAELAEQKVKALKKEIDDVAKASKTFTPEETFEAFQEVLGGVEDGFSMVNSAMDLFGVKSEFVTGAMEKISGAIELGDKVAQFIKIKDKVLEFGQAIKGVTIFQNAWNLATRAATAIQSMFGVATTGVGTAFKVLRGAIISTGIGALIVAIGVMVNGIMSWINSSNKAKAANENLANSEKSLQKSIKSTNDEIKKRNDNLDFANEQELAKARELGKSKDEIREIERRQQKTAIDNATTDLNAAYQRQYNITQQAEADLAKVKEDGDEDEIKEAQEHYDQIIADLQANVDEQLGILDQANKDKTSKEQSYRNEDADEQRRKDEEKAREAKRAAEEVASANKQSRENIRRTNQEIALLEIKDEDERAKAKLKQDLDNAILEINQSKATKKQKDAEILALQQKFALDEAALIAEQKKAKEEKEEEKRKDEADKLAEYTQQTTELSREIELAGMKDGFDKSKLELENQYKDRYAAIEANEKLTADQKLFLKLQLQAREAQELKKLEDEEAKRKYEKTIAEQQAILSDPKSSFAEKQAALDAEVAANKKALDDKIIDQTEFTKREDELAEARIQIAEKEKEAKIKSAQMVGNMLSAMSNLIGKETAAGKAFAVAAATINTWAAAQQAFLQAQKNPISIIGPAYPYIQAGLAVAQGIKNVKEILKVKTPGGGGGSAPTVMASPMTPQLGGTMLNQGQFNTMVNSQATKKNEPLRAYVVESDVRDKQERMDRINRAATIG